MSINSSEGVMRVLNQYNPWWRNPAAITVLCPEYRRSAFYDVQRTLRHKLRRFPLITGMRRTGKTTIMYQMIQTLLDDGVSPRDIMYVSFDNPILRQDSADHIVDVFDTLRREGDSGPKFIFLDEIQYSQDWQLWLKVLYDTRQDLRIAASGSASPVLEEGVSESGTGRWTAIRVPAMSFFEYCRILDIPDFLQLTAGFSLDDLANLSSTEFSALAAEAAPLRSHLDRFMLVGGFPELILSEDDEYSGRLLREDIVDKVIHRDILQLYGIRNPLLMEKLLLYLCINSGQVFSTQTAAKELEGVSAATVAEYIRALETSNLIHIAEPVHIGAKAALKSKPKIYIADAAVRNAVLMTGDINADQTMLGTTVETAVHNHVRACFADTGGRVGYYRTTGSAPREIDIVLDRPQDRTLIEVKYRSNTALSTKDGIVSVWDGNKLAANRAFLVTRDIDDIGPAAYHIPVPIVRVPTVIMLYVLGAMRDAQARRSSIFI